MPEIRMMIALSETMRREYLQLGVPEENLAIIPNAVDLARFRTPLKSRDKHESAMVYRRTDSYFLPWAETTRRRTTRQCSTPPFNYTALKARLFTS